MSYDTPLTLYWTNLQDAVLRDTQGGALDLTELLRNGRASYMVFEALVRHFTGFSKTTGSDHIDSQGRRYEQKAYKDIVLHPGSEDLFHTCASSTFGPNNDGPVIKKLLLQNDYDAARAICENKGYSKNDFYVYTNTGQYSPEVRFQYMIVSTRDVLKHLSSSDPRLISRAKLLSLATSEVELPAI